MHIVVDILWSHVSTARFKWNRLLGSDVTLQVDMWWDQSKYAGSLKYWFLGVSKLCIGLKILQLVIIVGINCLLYRGFWKRRKRKKKYLSRKLKTYACSWLYIPWSVHGLIFFLILFFIQMMLHHSRNLGFKFQLNQLNCLDKGTNYVDCNCRYLTVFLWLWLLIVNFFPKWYIFQL